MAKAKKNLHLDGEKSTGTPVVEPEETVADLDKDPGEVAAMFDKVARRYDLLNDLLSLGQVRIWRHATRAAVAAGPGERVLDIGAGTGTSSVEYAQDGAEVVASDFSEGMVAEGRRRYPQLEFVIADAMDLPFADNSFDVVTSSVALRNVHDPRQALREAYRVTKPGGRLVICEFSTPVWGPFQKLYKFYLGTALQYIAKLFASNKGAYGYLSKSILDWPDQRGFAQMISECGWKNIKYRNLSGGIVAIHKAEKPLD